MRDVQQRPKPAKAPQARRPAGRTPLREQPMPAGHPPPICLLPTTCTPPRKAHGEPETMPGALRNYGPSWRGPEHRRFRAPKRRPKNLRSFFSLVNPANCAFYLESIAVVVDTKRPYRSWVVRPTPDVTIRY